MWNRLGGNTFGSAKMRVLEKERFPPHSHIKYVVWIFEFERKKNAITHTHTHMSWAFANKTLDHMCWRQTNNSRRCNKGSTIAQIRQHRLVYALVFLVCNSDNSRVKIMNTTVDLRNRPSTEPSFSCTKPKFGENLNVLMKMQYLTYQFSWSKKKSQFS